MSAVVAEYEISQAVAQVDVEAFVTALVEAGLVEPVTS